jgi:hypothetical protein
VPDTLSFAPGEPPRLSLRAKRRDGDDVLEPLAPAAGHLCGEGVPLDGELVALQLGGDVVRRFARLLRAGRAVGVLAHELLCELERRRPVERRRQPGLLQRDRPADAEGGYEDRHGHGDPRGPVDASRDGPL